MPQTIRLTPQQQAIVDHNEGPALVYAVAGAGKTTAMVHRIARLVHDGVFPAHRILATSFNKDANRQIEEALQKWPACTGVRVRTLHALGYTVIRAAAERGYLPGFDPAGAGRSVAHAERTVLKQTLDRVRTQRDRLAQQLDNLDYDDFLAYVQRSKAALAFADPPTGLSWGERRALQTPQSPANRPWYRDLYRAYEATRTAAGILTFDDMLATGWLLLARHRDLLQNIQQRHGCVLVDEFQDVNRAQAEILDLLTRPGRNLMVIGDDDQTVYEWRGANPFFIRNFKKRYRSARVYFMTDNFRSRASHLALANRVIQQDHARQSKYLQLTRGFGGITELRSAEDDTRVAEEIVRTALHRHAAGISYVNMSILVRIYNQTIPIEDALRRAGIPCTVISETDSVRKRVTGVTITSIHRAKGLEWPVVFLPDCNDGVFPYRQSGNPDEERRLFYVALTRARRAVSLHPAGSPSVTISGCGRCASRAADRLPAGGRPDLPAAAVGP